MTQKNLFIKTNKLTDLQTNLVVTTGEAAGGREELGGRE